MYVYVYFTQRYTCLMLFWNSERADKLKKTTCETQSESRLRSGPNVTLQLVSDALFANTTRQEQTRWRLQCYYATNPSAVKKLGMMNSVFTNHLDYVSDTLCIPH